MQFINYKNDYFSQVKLIQPSGATRENCEKYYWKKCALARSHFFCPLIPAALMVQDFLIKIIINDIFKKLRTHPPILVLCKTEPRIIKESYMKVSERSKCKGRSVSINFYIVLTFFPAPPFPPPPQNDSHHTN